MAFCRILARESSSPHCSEGQCSLLNERLYYVLTRRETVMSTPAKRLSLVALIILVVAHVWLYVLLSRSVREASKHRERPLSSYS